MLKLSALLLLPLLAAPPSPGQKAPSVERQAAPGQSTPGQSTPAQSSPGQRTAGAKPAWQIAIDARRQALITENGSGTDTALRDRLLRMRETDQAARGLTLSASAPSPGDRLQHLADTDAQLTAELKEIVAQKGWPTIALVGIDASDAAMLLLTHTPDHAWQLSLLPQLEDLADAHKIDAAPLALVIDKQSVAAGRPQRYGSQFKNVNGHMAMFAVEDPGNLDGMRARAMLPPLDVYKQQLSRMYGLKVSNEIVSPASSAHTDSSRQ